MNGLSDFLFARPSFWEGVARILDFGGTLNEYNVSPTPRLADAWALRSDWVIVGRDISVAAETLRRDSVIESTRDAQT